LGNSVLHYFILHSRFIYCRSVPSPHPFYWFHFVTFRAAKVPPEKGEMENIWGKGQTDRPVKGSCKSFPFQFPLLLPLRININSKICHFVQRLSKVFNESFSLGNWFFFISSLFGYETVFLRHSNQFFGTA